MDAVALAARSALLLGGGLVLAAWIHRRHLALRRLHWGPLQRRLTFVGALLVALGAGVLASATPHRSPELLACIPIALLTLFALKHAEPPAWGHVSWLLVLPAAWVVRPEGGLVQDASWGVFATAHASFGMAWLGLLVLGLASEERARYGDAFAEVGPFLVGGAALTGFVVYWRAVPFVAGEVVTAGAGGVFLSKLGLGAVALGLAFANARLSRRGRLPWPPLAAECVLVAFVVVASVALTILRRLP